jgi:DNA-binding CsgD family transcriptional regulator
MEKGKVHLSKRTQIVLYGISLALLVFLLKWLEFRFLILNHSQEIFTGIVAVVFTGLGIWLALKLSRPRVETVTVEKEIVIRNADFVFNEKEAIARGLSRRELEVLELMSQGLSNQEIADKLFVSANTIKTHTRNLFEKLNVARRTQAVQIGRGLGLIP